MPNDAFSARSVSEPAVLDPVIARLALNGLRASPKTLPPQLFYDEEGCRLFYRITGLPEYYLTRTEWALLTRIAPKIASLLPRGTALVEYGASHEAKASLLFHATHPARFAAYVPIDVAAAALERLCARVGATFPTLAVHAVVGDFEQPITLPAAVAGMPRLGFFPGSTIGNLDPIAGRRFMRLARDSLGPGAMFLLGVDLLKPASVLVPAYDDSEGVTASFNRNVLVRLNREAAANFDPFAFDHRAIWNATEGRIEMHLVSQHAQVVAVAGVPICFTEGETIHTENSYKFTEDRVRALAEAAGWALRERWFDSERRFGVFLMAAE